MAQPRRAGARAPRRATTLLELMIALTVLTIGMGSILSHYATLHGLRRTTTRMGQAQDVLRALSERFTGWDVWALGLANPTVAPWSLPRWVGGYDVAGPLGIGPPDGLADDLPPMKESDLLTYQIIEEPIGMNDDAPGANDLRVYVEYYRYENDTSNPAARPGLIQLINPSTSAKPGDLEAAFIDNPVLRKQCRINPLIPPVEDIADQDTLVIRLIATWNGGHIETFVAKRRVPRSL
jgi:hypothetical protein